MCMKKILLSLFVSLIAWSSHAETASVDLTAKGYANAEEITEVKIGDDITATFDKGTGTTTPKYYTSGTAVRMYGGNTLTISCTAGKIVNIAFTTHSSNKLTESNSTVNEGTLDYDTQSWSGSASSVVITNPASKGHIRFQKIEVTYSTNENFLAAPIFSPKAGTYYGEQTITLTAAADASIFYSTNGTDFKAYTEPIPVSANTTISAYAQKGDVKSETETADYIIKPIETYTTLTALNEACTATSSATAPKVILNVADMLVTYVNGSNVFISDGTQGFLLFASNTTLKAGDRLTGTVQGWLYQYYGLKELAVDDWSTVSAASANNDVEAQPITISKINANVGAVMSSYVVISNVGFEAATLTQNKVTVMDEEGEEIQMFDKFGVLAAMSFNTTAQYIIKGFPCVNGTSIQFYPVEVSLVPTSVADPVFSLASGEYDEPQTLTITAADQLTIRYTVDGTDPSATEGLVYTEPLQLDTTVTIKAIAVDAQGNTSNVVSVSLSLPYITLAQLYKNCTATSSNTAPTVRFKASDLLVTGVKGNNIFVYSNVEEKGFYFYGGNSGLVKGDVISGLLTGKLLEYNGLAELSISDWSTVNKVSSGNAVTPKKVTTTDINNSYKELESQFVKLENVYFQAEQTTNSSVNVKDEAGEVIVYDKSRIFNGYTFNTTKTYTISGFVINYNGTPQLYPISLDDIVVGMKGIVAGNINGKTTIYNLQGQQLQTIGQSGIYVINGKAVYIKK